MMSNQTHSEREARELIESYCPPEARGGAMINSRMLEEDIAKALQSAESRGFNRAKEKAVEIAKGHYEEHCCEDCPCAYWRENVAQAIKELTPDE